MSRRAHAVLATVLALVLVALHLDFWREQRDVIWFGWIPEELLWRVSWMLLAWLYLLYFCAKVWRSEGEGR